MRSLLVGLTSTLLAAAATTWRGQKSSWLGYTFLDTTIVGRLGSCSLLLTQPPCSSLAVLHITLRGHGTRALSAATLLSPREANREPSEGRVSPDAAAIKAVHEVGVVRTRAVSRTTAEALRADVLEQLELARATTSTHGLGLTDSYLSSVLAPDNGSEQVRWDVRLALTPAVRMALREMLAVEAGSLTSIFEALAGGGDAELWECAAIVTAPGATAQPVHSDTEYSPSPCLFTAFVALQPVTADNGPTRFLPRTHTAEAHAPRSAADERTFLTSAASSVALLETGECALYDGRLLHCGTAHQGDELRVLFYVTFRHVNADSSLANEAAHSIRDEYKGALRLRDFSASGGELSDCTRKLYTS